jgi:hypothetical protein
MSDQNIRDFKLPPRPVIGHAPQRQAIFLVSCGAAMLGIIIARLLTEASPGQGITFLLALPVAVVAWGLGRGAGLAAAASAIGLVGAWATLSDVELGLTGYLTRSTIFLLVATIAGRAHYDQARAADATTGGGQAPAANFASLLTPREIEVLRHSHGAHQPGGGRAPGPQRAHGRGAPGASPSKDRVFRAGRAVPVRARARPAAGWRRAGRLIRAAARLQRRLHLRSVAARHCRPQQLPHRGSHATRKLRKHGKEMFVARNQSEHETPTVSQGPRGHENDARMRSL